MAKTALVLSGGGMFGAYQAGAWKALEGRLRPDVVAGASVGSLNGWCIAGGCPAAQLIEGWLDARAGAVMTPRLAWNALFDPRALERRAKTLVEEWTPRVEYGVVVVEVPRFRARLVRGGEVTWRHLAASCAAPVAYPPVRVGGKLYCDGGLLEALPLWTGAAMGATRVVGVNAWRPKGLPSRTPRATAGVEELIIAPARPLGTLAEAARWRRENIRRWIEQGERDAWEALKHFPFAMF